MKRGSTLFSVLSSGPGLGISSFLFDLDHPVFDLPWKASLGYDLSMTCGWMLDIRQTVFHLFNLHEVVIVVHN